MGEMGAVRMNKRLARSYRHENHPTPVPAASSDANVLSSLTGHHSSRLLSSNKSEAVFSTENSTVIIAQIGSKTYLPCAVRNLGSGVVSGTVNFFLFAFFYYFFARKTISRVSTQKRMHPSFSLYSVCERSLESTMLPYNRFWNVVKRNFNYIPRGKFNLIVARGSVLLFVGVIIYNNHTLYIFT